MAQTRLQQVSALGQSIWYDNIRRGLISSGELQRLLDEDAVVGITSNPTIFEKAIDGSTEYDEQMRELVGQGVTNPSQIFEALAIRDIQAAADLLRPIYDRTNGGDGFISLEVTPAAANDTTRTIAEARHLWARADRPNVMIKIPATKEGIPAIEQMIYEGANINVTLIFALDVHAQVADAYIKGLEHRRREGLPVAGIHSVASFFVSRVDTLVDKLLDQQIGETSDQQRQADLRALQGKAAIANARLAYQQYKEIFAAPRFATLRELGASPQRCLWASTSTKNPAYSDVLYAEALIGPETVDTMPPQTIVAFQDHGEPKLTLEDDLPGQRQVLQDLEAAGISMAEVTRQLELEGVKLFADSFDKLIESTREKTARLTSEAGDAPAPSPAQPAAAAAATPSLGNRQRASLGALQGPVDAALARADADHYERRIWQKDPALWQPNPADQREIVDRLGWLSVLEPMRDALPRLGELRDEVRAAGFTSVVLLGMGGSSLAPDVLRSTFGSAAGQPELLVLDSTDPATILAVDRAIDLPRTLFIVASKSGTTLETRSQLEYFFDWVSQAKGDQAGEQFIAITDAGTPLDTLAQQRKFRHIFRNPADIGGRYSALSYFGLVPASIIGVDVGQLLDRAETMAVACGARGTAGENPGLWLGTIMGTLATLDHDKLTIVCSPPISTFGAWLEQLLAESTGKAGKGIVPIEGEALGTPEVYGDDRLFVYLRTDEGADAGQDEALARLEQSGQPVVRLLLEDAYDLGGEFFRWEFATAVAGAILGINAFDQPNVQEAKDNTDRILQQYQKVKTLAQPPAILQTESRNVTIAADDPLAASLRTAVSLQAALEEYAHQVRAGDYVALLAYLPRTAEIDAALQHIRLRLRDTLRAATTLGYGPRFQHSTGQLHKGGRNNGVFIQLVTREADDVPIPGASYTFGTLEAAQALGDLQSLAAHKRRVIRIALGEDILAGLAELRAALDAASLA